MKFFILLALLFPIFLDAQEKALAIFGYDAVSYFTDDKPIMGQAEFQTEWQDLTWYFSNQENLNRFLDEPENYAPQFMGHCANGLSDGHLVTAKPEIYRIIDNKLYLFYSWWGKAQWQYQQQEQIELAEQWWSKFSEQQNAQ